MSRTQLIERIARLYTEKRGAPGAYRVALTSLRVNVSDHETRVRENRVRGCELLEARIM